MKFNRPPRVQTPLPVDEIEIPSPSNIPTKPGNGNWLTLALSFGAIVLTIIFIILISGGTSVSLGYLVFMPIMLVTYVASGISYFSAKKKYEKEFAKLKEDYRIELEQAKKKLHTLQEKQRDIMLENDPDITECMHRVTNQSSKLGERRLDDQDFLAPRLGLGDVNSTYKITAVESKGRVQELIDEYEFADQLVRKYSVVRDTPVTARLLKTGSIGIGGSSKDAYNSARSILCQLATHHWPSEVEIAAIATNNDSQNEWGWVSYLPHASTQLQWKTSQNIDKKDALDIFMKSLEALLQRREEISEAGQNVSENNSTKIEVTLPWIVILFDQLPVSYNHPGLSLLFLKGLSLGVIGIFVCKKVRDIPGGCGAILSIQNERLQYNEIGIAGEHFECYRPDFLSRKNAEDIARNLGEIPWTQQADLSRPPLSLGFLELFGFSKVDDLPIDEWWNQGSPFGYLSAPIGKISEEAPLIFNLSDKEGAHGPHGVIGGITGSGKSEALKTIILALAVTHHPYDLNFALVDYKGGAAFNELTKLPHTVGVVTDIENNASYAERVVQALSGEINYRKNILEEARRDFGLIRIHIDEYRKLLAKRLLPRLVIIFDEFAEFKQKHPEESKRLISIARLGRSLGIHLILATQNIQAAIDPEVLQNATFRMCLRVADVQDSLQMLGIRDAITLSRGRAYFSAQSRHLFQVAHSGEIYRYLERNSISQEKEISDEMQERTEAKAIVDSMIQLADDQKITGLSSIWPSPLPERLYLPILLKDSIKGGWNGQRWASTSTLNNKDSADFTVYPHLGLIDEPSSQAQYPLQIDPTRGEGHFLIFGSGKTGKSTLLRTYVSSIVHTRTPDEAWFFILDYGGQSALKVLDFFPHVSPVITRYEGEKTERLIQFFHARIAERNGLFRNASVDNWISYNNSIGENGKLLPALYLIIDGFLNLKRKYYESPEIINSITSLVNSGLASGVYIVISTNLPSDLPQDLFSNMNLRLTFHQADQRNYYEIVGQPSEAKIREDISKVPVAGRGLLRGTPPFEFQAALPVMGETDEKQFQNLKNLGLSMTNKWADEKGACPPEIDSLPILIPMPDVKSKISSNSVEKELFYTSLGKDYDTLDEVGFSFVKDGPTFLVAGASPKSGKTSILLTWAISLSERYKQNETQLVVIDFHSRTLLPLRNSPLVTPYVGIKSELPSMFDDLEKEIRRRSELLELEYENNPSEFDAELFLQKLHKVVVFIDDYEAFSYKITEIERNRLTNCLANGEELGFLFIIAGDASKLPSEFGSLGPSFLQRVKQHGCGILLGGSEGVEHFNNAQIPAYQRAAILPPGRGYIMNRGQGKLFQAYTCGNHLENMELEITKNKKSNGEK